MTDFAKVSFVKKILKDQGASHLSTIQLNNEGFSTFCFSSSWKTFVSIWIRKRTEFDSNVDQFVEFLKIQSNIYQWFSHICQTFWNNTFRRSKVFSFSLLLFLYFEFEFEFWSLSNKSKMPLRRSSRIRRAPTKCSCSSCVIHQTSHDEDFSLQNDDDSRKNDVFFCFLSFERFFFRFDFRRKSFSWIIRSFSSIVKRRDGKQKEKLDETFQFSFRDDQIVDKSMINDENSTQLVLPEVSKMIDENSSMENADLSSFDFLQDATTLFDENLPIFSSESFLSSSSISNLIPEEIPQRRTFVILTELDEPFFGPYPIEFTITIWIFFLS